MLTCGCFSSKTTRDIKSRKIVFVGDSLSGKSALLTSFLHKQFNPNDNPTTTVDIFYDKTLQINGKSIDLVLFDTSGRVELDRLRPLVYPETGIVVICFNVDEPQSLINVTEKWIPEIRHFCGRCPVILLACKIDLRDDPETILKLKERNEKPIRTKTGRKIASEIHADDYMECSAKTHEGVEDLFLNVSCILSRPGHARTK